MIRQARDERGSASIEVAIGLPAFILFVGLIIAGGRLALAHQALQTAAADAARSASIARDAGSADSAARREAHNSLSNQNLRCRSTDVRIDTSGFRVPTGRPADVRVTLTCRVDLADLSVPGVPGSRLITATMISPIDTWRERGPS
ncbi:TadE/TadG family type IV pilus assembly protein [Nocardioides sp. NPDC051685]|uniref:TadE/TadG family type IV pilus assembly protein n=1 Tax=Nocardioides sp. NPDC051685 TaxID=3364334 RepID=UPI003798F6F3